MGLLFKFSFKVGILEKIVGGLGYTSHTAGKLKWQNRCCGDCTYYGFFDILGFDFSKNTH
jgi:hypothetical protein